MRFLKVLAIWLATINTYAVAQTTAVPDAEKAFRDSLVNQTFVLRNFSDDLRVRAHWTGTKLEWQPPYWRSVGLLKVKTVDIKQNEVLIRGERAIALRDGKHGYVPSSATEPIEVVIAMDGNPATALSGLKPAVFFDSIADALAAIPSPLQDVLPSYAGSDSKEKPARAGKETCDCMDRGTPACEGKQLAGSKLPKVLSAVDPNFSDDAKQNKISGSVLVGVVLNASGTLDDLWILRPFGHGLDQQAAYAVSKYRFSAATCHGVGIKTEINVEVNFDIH